MAEPSQAAVQSRAVARVVVLGPGPTLLAGRGWQVLHCPSADGETAVREVESARKRGATRLVFPWFAFWWVEFYAELADYLIGRFERVEESDRLLVYSLT